MTRGSRISRLVVLLVVASSPLNGAFHPFAPFTPLHDSRHLPHDVYASRLCRPSVEESSSSELSESPTFESLGLSKELMSAVRSQSSWNVPTPIQALAIPHLLKDTHAGTAAWCQAPTGSGKSAAFVLPLLQRLLQSTRHSTAASAEARIASLILCPTRELAVQLGTVVQQVSDNVGGRKRWNIQVIHGGVPLEPQIVALAQTARDGNTVDVVVATPGRLSDVLTYYDDNNSNDDNGSSTAQARASEAALERRLLDALDAQGKSDASLSLAQIEALELDDIVDSDGRTYMRHLLEGLEYLVLDEADRLLSRAFQTELDAVLDLLLLDPSHTTRNTQTWLFSATFPKQIEPRVDAVLKQLGNEKVVRISCAESDRLQDEHVSGRLKKKLERATSNLSTSTLQQVGPASTIQLRTIRLEKRHRTQGLRKLLEEHQEWDRVLVFVATRYAAEHVARKLRRVGIQSAELHGKLDQEARLRRLNSFRKGRVRVLLATDVASRGLDVVGLPAVVNYDLPRSTADFVHRCGRTGRAGRTGTAITFLTPASEAHFDLIERRHLMEPTEREVLPGFEPDEEEWQVQSEAVRMSIPGAVHSSRGLAHDRMHGGIKGRRKSKKDRLREQAAREAATTKRNE